MGLNRTYWKKIKDSDFWWEHKAKDLPVRKNANNFKYVRRASKGGENKYFQASTFELWLDRAGIVFDRYGDPFYSDGSFMSKDHQEKIKNDYIRETGIIPEVDFLNNLKESMDKAYQLEKDPFDVIQERLDLIIASKKQLEVEERSVEYNPSTLPDWTRKYNLLETLVDQGPLDLSNLTKSKSYTGFTEAESILKSQLRFVRGFAHMTRNEVDRLINELKLSGFVTTKKIPHPKMKSKWVELITLSSKVTMWLEPIYMPQQNPTTVKWKKTDYVNPYKKINPLRLYATSVERIGPSEHAGDELLPTFEEWISLKEYGETYLNHKKIVERLIEGTPPEFKVKIYDENRKHQAYKKRKKHSVQNYVQSHKPVKEIIEFKETLKRLMIAKLEGGIL